MQEQILKLPDSETKKTHYVFHPERILDLTDSADGCVIHYGGSQASIVVADKTARQMKRIIQEQILDGMGFLKLESIYLNHKGKRYINVDHIAGVVDHGNGKCEIILEHFTYHFGVNEEAFDVAYQIRRVIKRLDQDQELCCEPDVAPEPTDE